MRVASPAAVPFSPLGLIYEDDEQNELDHDDPYRPPPKPNGAGSSPYYPPSLSAVDDFLTDDDGISLLDDLPELSLDPSFSSVNLSPWARTSPLASVSTFDSVLPHLSQDRGTRALALATFCDLIRKCASLERAKIVSVDCYRERSKFGILHRGLVFHLQRSRRTDVWLRVDRLRAEKVSLPALALRRGKTESNDVVRLADRKESLLKRPNAKPENRIEFRSPPSLADFRFYLQIICEELLEYRVWPENCWFLCSLLQEHLFQTGRGYFVTGHHVYLSLASTIRSQVSDRAHHVVSGPPSVAQLLIELSNESIVLPGQKLDLQALAADFSTSDIPRRIPTIARHGPLIGRLSVELDNFHYQYSRRHPETLSNAFCQLSVHMIGLERMFAAYLHTRRVSRLSRALEQYRSYFPHVGCDPAPFRTLEAFRVSYAVLPTEQWYSCACEHVRAARILSHLHPQDARTCASEALRIVREHFDGQRRWTDGQVLLHHEGAATSVAFSPDGMQIVSGWDDGCVRRWDARTGEPIGEAVKRHTSYVSTVGFTSDGRELVSASYSGTFLGWDSMTGVCMARVLDGEEEGVSSRAASSSSLGGADRTIIALNGPTLQCWDMRSRSSIGPPIEGHKRDLSCLALSSDAKLIAFSRWDSTIHLHEVATSSGISGMPLVSHTGTVTALAFSPDGGSFVSGGGYGDCTLQLWAISPDRQVEKPRTFEGHESGVTAVAFSPNGNLIVSGDEIGVIRCWSVQSGSRETLGAPLVGHKGPVTSLAFSPDGGQIVSGAGDGTVLLWDALLGGVEDERWHTIRRISGLV